MSAIEASGLLFSGVAEKQHATDTSQRMEVIELPEAAHPFFVAVQFHPEFKSRPLEPSPPFRGFVQASAVRLSTCAVQSMCASLLYIDRCLLGCVRARQVDGPHFARGPASAGHQSK